MLGLLALAVAGTSGGAWFSVDFSQYAGAKTYAVDGVKVTLQPIGQSADAANIAASVSASGFQTVLSSEDGGSGLGFPRQVGIGKLSKGDMIASVLLQSYSGGAHCCADLRAIVPIAGQMKTLKVGSFDGEGLKSFPKDIDGDGNADFVMNDDRFNYAFGSYAGSWAPPKVLNIYKGQVIDVSAQPAFRSMFERFSAKAKLHCADRTDSDRNGACAGYVAAEARLGRFPAAIKFATSVAYKGQDATFPDGCAIDAGDGDCPDRQKVKFYSFLTSVRAFLRSAGYID